MFSCFWTPQCLLSRSFALTSHCVGHVKSGRVNRVEASKQMLQTDDVKHRVFRTLEEIPLPRQQLERLHPSLVSSWKTSGESQSVSCPWEMVMAMSLGAVLESTSVHMSTTTSELNPVLWTFLMHPGSTHTSNLIGLYHDVFDVIEDAVNADRAVCKGLWNRQQRGRASDSENPFAGDVNMTAESGTLEGEAKLLAPQKNLGRCYGFTPEGKRPFMRLQNEGHLKESIVVDLHERATWRRTTMDGTHSFALYYPFFVPAGALHPPDVAKWSLEKDLLEGLLSDQFLLHASDFQAGARGWRRPQTSLFVLLSVWGRPCPNISCGPPKFIEEGLRKMCPSACEMNLRKMTAGPQACAPSTVSSNRKMRNTFLPCSIERWAIDLVNSASADDQKFEPEEPICDRSCWKSVH